MKFSCEKALLQAAINTTSRTVAQKSSIPALEGLLLQVDQQVTVSGYNMNTGIRTNVWADIQTPGKLVLNARLFGDIVRKMPDDIITVSADPKGTVHLTCGAAHFDIVSLPCDDYPALPEIEEEFSLSLPQKTLRSMIEGTSFAVSTNEARPIHTGSLFEVSATHLTMVAVDGFRLAIRKEPLPDSQRGGFSFVAPGSAINEVQKICGDVEDSVTLLLGKRHVMFQIGDTELICRRLEGDFLDYKNAIPRRNAILLKADTKQFIQSIDRVSVMISEKLKSPVRCHFGNNQVSLSAKTGNGDANDICPLTGDGQDLVIGFNNRYLMDALRHAPADEVTIELNTSVSPAIIVPTEGEEHFLYMVLPVRLKGTD